MNRYTLVKAGIDVSRGLQRVGGDMVAYQSLLKEFTTDTHFAQLQDAMEKKDAEAAFQAAHALKGITSTLCIEDLHQAVLPLVEALRARDLLKAEPLFPPLPPLYQKAVEAIKSQIS